MTTPTIRLDDATRAYDTPAGTFAGIRNANLEVAPGEFVAIVGKSGSGKSTLLNLVTGIDRPTSGEIHIAGTALSPLSEDKLASFRGAHVGVVFQFQQLMPTLTIAENVMMPMDFLGTRPRADRRPRALELLEDFGVAGHADKYPSELSGGQQQRVAIARAVANEPAVIAADEPTGNLDSASADTVLALLAGLTAGGTSVVMVTHERDIARKVHRTVIVADGEIKGGARG